MPLYRTLLISLCFFAGGLLLAAENFDPESERLMEVRLSEGYLINPALAIYPRAQTWILPLGELSQNLGFPLNVSPVLGQAEGYLLDSSVPFRLDLGRCRVRVGGKEKPYPCGDVAVHEDEIYVLQSLLESWLPIQIDINTFRSEMKVKALVKLPVQLRKEREALAGRSKGLKYESDPGFPRAETPHAIFEGPVLDNQLTVTPGIASANPMDHWQYSTQLGGEIAGLESFGFVTGRQTNHVDAWRLRLERRAPEGGLLGPLNARSVQFIDVDLPALPLISQLTPGRGFLISSYPLNQPTTFESTDFAGPLQTGWEVLLYRNDVLLDRAVDTGNGRYLFREVPLFYGRNTFRFSFFGPQGERRDEYKTFNIGPDLALPGEHQYRFGMISNLDTRDARQRGTLLYNKNFLKHFTLTTGTLYESQAPRNYALLGLSGVNDIFLFTTNCAFSTTGGKACEWGGQTGSDIINFGLKYTRLFDFQSEIFNKEALGQLSQLGANLSWFLPLQPAMVMTWEALRKNFIGDLSQTLVKNRLAVSTGLVYWRNELTYEVGAPVPVTGLFDLNFFVGLAQVRWGMEYTPHKLTLVKGELRYTAQNAYSFGVASNYSLESRKPTFTLGASRLLDSVALGADFTFASKESYQTNLRLAFSLGRDPRDGEILLNRMPMTQTGYGSVKVFVDKNRNGRPDPDEAPIPGARVVLNQRDADSLTDANGKVFLYNLIPHLPVDVNLSPASLEDPSLRPEFPGVRFIPRAGKFTEVNLPVWVVGEIDGAVTYRQKGKVKPKRGVLLELIAEDGKVRETTTDREGFYSFDAVAPGRYRIRIAPRQLRESQITASPPFIEREVDELGTYLGDQNFQLEIP